MTSNGGMITPNGASTCARLVEQVRANVAELLDEFATFADDAGTGGRTGADVFAKRLRDYVMRFGSMRRTRVAGHAFDAFLGGDDAGLRALGQACAPLEMFHAAALIHDDIIDESPTRRHQPAFHMDWSGIGYGAELSPISSARLGVAAGILAGDALLVLCARAIDRVAHPAKERVADFFQQMQLRTVVGEFQDSVLELAGPGVDRAAITEMSVGKTAWYTVIAPMILAAHCAGVDDTRIPLLIEAGSAYGEAFQLLDDVNEIIGDPAVIGKSSLDDMKAGKATLLHHIVSTHATADQRAVLDATYGRGDCTDADLDQYRRLVDAHSARVFGDLRALMDKARSLLREAGFRHHSISRIEDELAPYQLLPALLNESA